VERPTWAIHGASMEDLFRAHFDQPVPSVTVDGGTVTVQYPRFSPRGWLRPGARRGGNVTLNQDMAWHITVRGGVAHLDADLRDLRLEALELGQGASQVEVRLPRPAGVVPVRVRGGVSQVRIRRPAGVPAQLRVGRGVADLRFDEQEWGAVGGGAAAGHPRGHCCIWRPLKLASSTRVPRRHRRCQDCLL
jgi:hypothetical protein